MTAQLGQHIATSPLKYKGEKNSGKLARPIKNSRELEQCSINDLVLSNRSYGTGDHCFLTNRKIMSYIVYISVIGDLWYNCYIQGAWGYAIPDFILEACRFVGLTHKESFVLYKPEM